VTRALAATPVGLLAFALALALTALAVGKGLMADDAVLLWASAISAGGGEVPIGRIIASYPTLPFLFTTCLEFVTPSGTPTPALLAAGLLALLAAVWFLAFRASGLSRTVAAGATALTALHPAMLAACLAGAAEMCLAAFLYLLGSALFDLRARTAAPEVMAVGLALLGLAFSHPTGAALTVAAVPCLAFAVRPSTVANSAANVMLALVFPTIFSIGAFAYVSWVFPGNGWSFLASPAESLAAWAVDASSTVGSLTGSLTLDAALVAALVLALGAPLAPLVLGWVRERRPLVTPPIVFAATVVLAAATAAASGLFGSPAPIAVAAPVLAALLVARVPDMRARRRAVLALLGAGWLGGTLALATIEPRTAAQLHAAPERAVADQGRLDALSLGGVIADRRGVLVDTNNAPAVVLGRGQSRGLIEPSDPDFTLALLFSRIDAPFVAVPDPHSPSGVRDQLNKTFPRLYRDGQPGYRLIYRNATWRLYARQELNAKESRIQASASQQQPGR
jgi:hypothetical protein